MAEKSAQKIYGVLGYPARHSLSPAMHNAAFRSVGLKAEYLIFEKDPSQLEGFLDSLNNSGISGLNVTVPYKEKVSKFLTNVSADARLIQAVNTIKVEGNSLSGFNTDGQGFMRHLSGELGFNPAGKRLAILGAGGASKAISVYLSKNNPSTVTIYDIDREKVRSLVGYLERNFPLVSFNVAHSTKDLSVEKCDLLINATPVGMKEDDPCLIDESMINPGSLVYDLIYNPAETKLLSRAKKRGARISNGLGMLLWQGAHSFEIWTGLKAPVEVMKKALESSIYKH